MIIDFMFWRSKLCEPVPFLSGCSLRGPFDQMHRVSLLMCAFAIVFGIRPAFADPEGSGCDEALVRATYSRIQLNHDDWRLASYVTKDEWNEVNQKAGASALIYGIPVGASWEDYENRVKQEVNSYKESLTHDQALNVMWTGLDPNAPNAYAECLKAKVLSMPGLHLTVSKATKNEVSVNVQWTPQGSEHNAKPEWQWRAQDYYKLPKTLQPGTTSVVLLRPNEQTLLSVNYHGRADTLVISPYPKPPTKAIANMVETDELYTSPRQDGWGENWSQPYALCTPQKPEGWTIVKIYDFHMDDQGTDRGSCGRFTTCTSTETPTHYCWITTVQGHNEKNPWGGHGYIVTSFHVVWKHPEYVH